MKRLAVSLLVLLLALAGGAWLALRGSLPALDGERPLPGLEHPVDVSRDALGVVTIRGRSRLDVARATGYVHAQERFFQMDLLRRATAGELSALFGRKALERDRARRFHRLRDVAQRALAGFTPEDRALLDHYTAGVNAGLADLAVRPFEYLVLRATPLPWQPEDSVLAVLGMFLQLNDEDGRYDTALGHLREVLPPPLLDFMVVKATGWDVPLEGEAPGPVSMPGPEVCDLRTAPPSTAHGPASDALRLAAGGDDAAGSNAWALGGDRTDGAALVANDMHLGHAVPNVWFRARLVVGEPDQLPTIDVAGATLPGAPAVVAGSNGRVAWGLTNSNGDWTDVVELELDPDNAERYATAEGYRELGRVEERIEVRGGEPETLVLRTTRWGPVAPDEPLRAVRWMAHLPGAVDIRILALEHARNVPDALDIAWAAGVPPLNFVVGDHEGRIAWTITGRIPARAGYDGQFPVAGRDHAALWTGWRPHADYPTVVDPPGGRIWSANARQVFGPGLAVIGEGNYVLGARAHQVRAGLMALDRAQEADMLALQLDDEARFLAGWRHVALTLGAGVADARRAEALDLIGNWQPRAAVDAVGYRLVRAFREEVLVRALGPLLRTCGDAEVERAYAVVREAEGPLWRLVSERPLHLLDARYAGWDELLLDALDAAIASCGDRELALCTWGEHNRVVVAHPLSRAVPVLSRWLDMPSEPLPGDEHMPLAQKPRHGPSERFGVAPGHESEGYFHMPGGQSGHPLSPFYRAGHDAWARGEPVPFLPGKQVHRLRLAPGEAEAGPGS